MSRQLSENELAQSLETFLTQSALPVSTSLDISNDSCEFVDESVFISRSPFMDQPLSLNSQSSPVNCNVAQSETQSGTLEVDYECTEAGRPSAELSRQSTELGLSNDPTALFCQSSDIDKDSADLPTHSPESVLADLNQQPAVLHKGFQLPNEILLHVFKYLSPQELCRHVSAVCKQWHCLAREPNLWRNLDMSNSRVSERQVRHVFKHASGAIRYLTLPPLRTLSVNVLVKLKKHCKQLVHLDMSCVEDVNPWMMWFVLESCRYLQSLSVSRCRCVDNTIILAIVGSAGPSLKGFNFDFCDLDDIGLRLMMEHMADIAHISIDGMPHISECAIHELITTFSHTLKSLHLEGSKLTDWALHPLAQCHLLQSLSISHCANITHSFLHTLATMGSLKKLVLREGKKLWAGALMEVFSTWTMARLTHLDLSHCCHLDDQGVEAISQTCNVNLRILCLSWCVCVSDKSMAYVATSCIRMERMELVGLHRLHASWLPMAVDSMPLISFISFQLCQNVRTVLLEEAVKRIPCLTLLNYYGDKVVGHTNTVDSKT